MDIDEEYDSLGLPSAKKSLAWQARAKITWGDPSDDVQDWLVTSGIDAFTAEQIVSVATRERAIAVRAHGVRDLVLGIALGLAGAGGVIGAVSIAKLGLIAVPIKGLAVLVALSLAVSIYGVHLALRGFGRILVGGGIRGAVSDIED
jgi:hypothetical protein